MGKALLEICRRAQRVEAGELAGQPREELQGELAGRPREELQGVVPDAETVGAASHAEDLANPGDVAHMPQQVDPECVGVTSRQDHAERAVPRIRSSVESAFVVCPPSRHRAITRLFDLAWWPCLSATAVRKK